jgi:ClpP class serine protease
MEWIPARLRRGTAVVPVVRLSGLIGAVTPLRPGMSLAGVARTLERAFAMKNAKAVALVINSPGGSPVQSRQIYLRIRQLATEKKLPVLVFVEDVAASGGYMIACAGDEIFCDPSSILGSIGVVGGSFGFQELISNFLNDYKAFGGAAGLPGVVHPAPDGPFHRMVHVGVFQHDEGVGAAQFH